MKFTKFGKALLMSALSAGVILCVTSCVRSYTVGFIYVTGTVTAQSTGNGIISGYKIDHNTGFLTPINGLPVSSGGANPGRAVLLNGSRFLYVLNQGVNAQGGSTCTTANPCQNSNITEFAVGGNGILTPQQTFYTQGINPFRMLGDSSGNYLLVLDHDSPLQWRASTCKLGAAALSATSLRRHHGLPDQPDHGPPHPGCQCPGYSGGRNAAHLLPGSRQSHRLCAGLRLHRLTLERNPGNRRRRLPVHIFGFQRPVDPGPEQLLSRWASTARTAIVNASGVIYVLDNEPVTIPIGRHLHRRHLPRPDSALYRGHQRRAPGRDRGHRSR